MIVRVGYKALGSAEYICILFVVGAANVGTSTKRWFGYLRSKRNMVSCVWDSANIKKGRWHVVVFLQEGIASQ